MNPLVIVIPVLILSMFAVMAIMAAYKHVIEYLQRELSLAKAENERLRADREDLREENLRLKYELERNG